MNAFFINIWWKYLLNMNWNISICLKKHTLTVWLTDCQRHFDWFWDCWFVLLYIFFIRDCVFSWIASNVRTMETYRLNFVLFVFFVIDNFIKNILKNGMTKEVRTNVYNRKISEKDWHFSQFGTLIKQTL